MFFALFVVLLGFLLLSIGYYFGHQMGSTAHIRDELKAARDKHDPS